MRPVFDKIRSRGVTIIDWVDDFIFVLSKDLAESKKMMKDIVLLLERLGFMINKEKSVLHPVFQVSHRGFIWNSKIMTVRAKDKKLPEINAVAALLLQQDFLALSLERFGTLH